MYTFEFNFYEFDEKGHPEKLSLLFSDTIPYNSDVVYAKDEHAATALWRRYKDGEYSLRGSIQAPGQEYPYRNIIHDTGFRVAITRIPALQEVLNDISIVAKEHLNDEGEILYLLVENYRLHICVEEAKDGGDDYYDVFLDHKDNDGKYQVFGSGYTADIDNFDCLNTACRQVIEEAMHTGFMPAGLYSGTAFKREIDGEACLCYEAKPGLMRLELEGCFGWADSDDYWRKTWMLIPCDMADGDIEVLADHWLTEQEKELGFAIGESCNSSGWCAGSFDSSKDSELTNKYDWLVKRCYHAIELDTFPADDQYFKTAFSVDVDWLQGWLGDETIEEFLRSNWLWDDTYPMYDTAKSAGKILWETQVPGDSRPVRYE